jgi:hypothetical protein
LKIRQENNLSELRRRFFERNKRSKEALLREDVVDHPVYPELEMAGTSNI